jgi:hypothetical protein
MASVEHIQFASRWAAGFLIALTLECGLLGALLFLHRALFYPWYFSVAAGSNTNFVIGSGVTLLISIVLILGADLAMAWCIAKFVS